VIFTKNYLKTSWPLENSPAYPNDAILNRTQEYSNCTFSARTSDHWDGSAKNFRHSFIVSPGCPEWKRNKIRQASCNPLKVQRNTTLLQSHHHTYTKGKRSRNSIQEPQKRTPIPRSRARRGLVRRRHPFRHSSFWGKLPDLQASQAQRGIIPGIRIQETSQTQQLLPASALHRDRHEYPLLISSRQYPRPRISRKTSPSMIGNNNLHRCSSQAPPTDINT
jgi:hypothetical protein